MLLSCRSLRKNMRDKILDKTVDFLGNQQQRDGSFLSLSSAGKDDFFRARQTTAIFPTFLVLSCLGDIDTKPAASIKQKATQFLLTQKSAHWSFNYWKKNSRDAKSLPYPDDLDDTCCALAAILTATPKLLDAGALAKIVTLLTAVEKKEGGPYHTWLVPPGAGSAWRDVDLVVNSNVAYFLALQDIFLPNLRKFVCDKIEKKEISSKYYPSIFPVSYFIARYLALDKKISSETKRKLSHFILLKRQKNGSWGNLLHTSLAVSSLLRLGVEPKELASGIEFLEKEIKKGKWPAHAICLDPVTDGKQYYAGSRAATAAFCLEAMSQFKVQNSKFKVTHSASSGQASQKIYDGVVRLAKQRFSQLDTDLGEQALSALSRTIKSDKDKQIILFPHYFQNCLNDKARKKLITDHGSLITSLGLANLYGWMAYRIYDDFFDGEGNPEQLSVANVCLREATSVYNSIQGFTDLFNEVADMLDGANAWEVVHTRFLPKQGLPKIVPDYGNYSQLADKSFGHALGPLAILTKLGYLKDSREIKQFLSFFRHYIIARQLNDDAHDWEEDLARGQINAVGAMVLARTKDETKLRNVFWQRVIQEVCQIILENIREARFALNKCHYIKNKLLLSSLLVPIEQSAQKAIDEQKEAVAFMQEYGKKV